MTVDPSTVASWGSPEDRSQRDRRRGFDIGHAFMAAFHGSEGGKKKHDDSGWFRWMRANTALELRWMWSRDLQYMKKNADAYAQVAGELILEETAKGNLFSGRWFRTDISKSYGWLFEPACLEHDGWQLVDRKVDGKTFKTWTKPSG